MEASGADNQLLKNKYNLHKSPEVENAAKRTQQRTGEKVPQDPLIRIQNYLNRLNNIINPRELEGKGHSDFDRKERNLEMLKHGLYEKFVIKPDEISENYWENQKRIIRERGQGGDLEHANWEDLKRQNTEAIIADQRSSMDKWIDYLSSPDAPYPDSLKYFTLRSVLSMGEYDKEKKATLKDPKGQPNHSLILTVKLLLMFWMHYPKNIKDKTLTYLHLTLKNKDNLKNFFKEKTSQDFMLLQLKRLLLPLKNS